jgi:hypothetical protein
MTALSVAISRRLGVRLSDHQAWESQMRAIAEFGTHLPSARWARLAMAIEKCVPHLQEELRELEAWVEKAQSCDNPQMGSYCDDSVSQNTGLKETADSCNANA